MKILEKLEGKADKGEVFFVETTARSVTFKGWKIHSSHSSRESGFGIRVIVDGKIGTSSSTDLDDNTVDNVIENAITSAKFGENIELDFPKKTDVKTIDINDEKVTNAPIPTLIDYGSELMERMQKYRSDCDMEIGVSTTSYKIRVANTEGFDNEYEKTSFSMIGSLMRVKGNDIYMAWDYYDSTHLPEKTEDAVSRMVKRIDEIMQYADKIVEPPSAENIPVIFTPDGTLVLLAPLSQGVNGSNIYAKTSPIYDKMGEKIFDEKLSIFDDGLIDRKSASTPFDDEGTPKKRFPIIENGVLKNFVFDLMTARKSGYTSNGCASRSIFSPPQPNTSNVIVEAGDVSLKDMMADIKEGLMVESVLGLGQGNILSGAFSNPISTGFKIENGEIVGRVKNMAIAGNIYQILQNITAISSERKWFYGRFLSPYIRLDNISVVGN
ncbi:TldD/PmbA family protein [bacterium]|nr:TldD/PmbA family protein [bacterium]